MPLYEYRCPACERRFEVLQRLGATADGLVCPACGHDRVERAFSTFACAGTGVAGAEAGCAPRGGFS
jgi:putative FmdB family regulatory protein